MKGISAKVPESLVQEVDELLHVSRYGSRSDLIRTLLRRWVEEHKIQRKIPAQ